LNTGLSTGLIGAGIGKLGGMSTQDALRMGLTSGATAAALQGLKNNTTLMDKGVTREDLVNQARAEGTPAQGTGRFTGINEAGPAGQIGTTGTAQDLLQLKVDGRPIQILDNGRYVFTDGGAGSSLQLPPGAAPEPGYTVAGAAAPGTAPINPNAPLQLPPGAAPEAGYAVAGAENQGFFDKMATGAKNLYNEYLSPSRAGLPADAGILQKYGPLALAGTAAVAATGGMQGEPANQNPAFNRAYTGSDYMRDNPDRFSGGLSTYTRPDQPSNPIVPTPSYGSIPIGQPGVVMPGGVTMSPGGVAQPYNVAGLYGVPIIYGPDGQPRRMAKGGDAKMTHFPRRNGPISGPGTGTSDDIPAMLSDGEFVFTAKAVRNAGGGSRRKGAARMYKLMKKLEGGPV